MKNRLLPLLCMGLLGTVMAQSPVFTSEDYKYTLDSVYTVNAFEWTDPGEAGEDVTWDLSGVETLSSFEYILKKGSEYPDASDVSTITYAGTASPVNDAGQWEALSVTNNGLFRTGVRNGEMAYVYSKAQPLMKFPLQYGDTVSDTFSAEFVFEYDGVNYTYIRAGKCAYKVDGYGTLELPTKTIENVLRVLYTEDYSDEYRQGSMSLLTTDYTSETYYWQVRGAFMGYASVTTLSTEFQTMSLGSFYDYKIKAVKDQDELNTEEPKKSEDPNNYVSTNVFDSGSEPYNSIDIYTSNGVYCGSFTNTPHCVNISDFLTGLGYESGVYIAVKKTDSKTVSEKLIVKN